MDTSTPHSDAPRARLALAPMEGVTDAIVRGMFAALGGVDWCVTEFVRISESVLSPRVVLRDAPEVCRGGSRVAGVPVHFQLLGGDPDRMAESARVAVSCGARWIDLNFGCPAPTVNRHDGGATLLKEPRRVHAVTGAVRRAVEGLAVGGHAVTVSAKVRLGWDDPGDVGTIVRAAEDGGADWITVHGRTRVQGYAPPADWEAIGAARAAVRVPVVANGDLKDAADVARCAAVTGCDAFMLGRGAVARPEVFRVIRGLDTTWWEPVERIALLAEYFTRARVRDPQSGPGALARTKQWARALASGDARLEGFFERFKVQRDPAVAFDSLRHDAGDAALERVRSLLTVSG